MFDFISSEYTNQQISNSNNNDNDKYDKLGRRHGVLHKEDREHEKNL